jgi:ribose 5-phosphate isomerase
MFTGVVEVGLFCDMAEAAYFGLEVCPVLPSSNDG